MSTPTAALIVHAVVVVAGLVAYVVLTATGHDGDLALASALAWAGGATVDRATTGTRDQPPTSLTPPRP
jgi:hypothetical protein